VSSAETSAGASAGGLPPELDDPLFHQAVGQVGQVVERADVDEGVVDVLRIPERSNADGVATRLVAEAANGPTTLEADEVLAERGIPVLPDILMNAGGVAVSYFEWVQDIQRLFWSAEEIRSRLGELMRAALDRVWRLAEGEALPLRRATLVLSVGEVATALSARGIYP
jgi:Glutamate/Leucine/Phenylalanine/Valine dehydrogenase